MWKFKKYKRKGPVQVTLTNKGVTGSVRVGGLRYSKRLSFPKPKRNQQVIDDDGSFTLQPGSTGKGVRCALIFALICGAVMGFVIYFTR